MHGKALRYPSDVCPLVQVKIKKKADIYAAPPDNDCLVIAWMSLPLLQTVYSLMALTLLPVATGSAPSHVVPEGSLMSQRTQKGRRGEHKTVGMFGFWLMVYQDNSCLQTDEDISLESRTSW